MLRVFCGDKAALLAVVAVLTTSLACAADLAILIPLYTYPAWYNPSAYLWDDVARAGTNVPITAIVNPASGPGDEFPNSDYLYGMEALQAGGVRMIGYVHTAYGTRSLDTVKDEINQYAHSPLVTGIFFDEVASGTDQLAYYTNLYGFVHAKTNVEVVILNPGTQIAEPYLSAPAGDTAVIFETGSGWADYVPDTYLTQYPASRFAALVYDCPDVTGMQEAVDLAVRRNIGFIYVTDDSLPNPWDTLPTYWTQLVAEVGARRSATGGATGLTITLR